MSFKLLTKTLRPKGQIYILPPDGNILKAYNSKDTYKKPMSIFRKYNIYIYTYNKKYKQYLIDCTRITSKSKNYIFLFKKGNKLWLMWHKERGRWTIGKLLFDSEDPIVKAINKYYKEQCSSIPHISSDIFETIGKFVPSSMRYVGRSQKKLMESEYIKRITQMVTKQLDRIRSKKDQGCIEISGYDAIDYVIKELADSDNHDMIAYALKNKIQIPYDNEIIIFNTFSVDLANYAIDQDDNKLLSILSYFSYIEWYNEYDYVSEDTPIIYAIEKNKIESLKMIIKSKTSGYIYIIALSHAIGKEDDYYVIELLLNTNELRSVKNYNKEYDPLYIASRAEYKYNNFELFRLLIDYKYSDIYFIDDNYQNVFSSIGLCVYDYQLKFKLIDIILKHAKKTNQIDKLIINIGHYLCKEYPEKDTSKFSFQFITHDINIFVELWKKNSLGKLPEILSYDLKPLSKLKQNIVKYCLKL